jgi:hypothetical protein
LNKKADSMPLRLRALAALSLVAVSALLIPESTTAQTSQGLTPFLDPSDQGLSARVSTFYRNPRLDDVPKLLAAWGASASARRADGMPPMIGFVAGLAEKYPAQIDKMFPSSLAQNVQAVVVTGVQIGGRSDRAEALARSYGWSQQNVAAAAARGRTLRDIEIKSANALDILWGASFATGDPRHVRRIADFYASVANRSDVAIDDLVTIVRTVHTKQGDLRWVRQKYGDSALMQIVLAATALWALESNARQHPFVRQTVDRFLIANSEKPAAKGLKLLN